MMIHEITIHTGKYKTRKRIGRGEGSGHGKTAGRGHKGAASRSGWKRRPGYEGGQMPMFRRMPKRGFTNAPFRRLFHVINVKQLDARFDDGTTVTCESLVKAGLIRDTSLPLKVLGEGTLSKKLDVTAARFSASAKTKIEEAGGTVTVDAKKKWTRAGAAFAKAALDAGKSAEAAEIAKGKKTKKAKDAPDAESAEKAAVAAEIAKGKKTKKAKDALDAESAEAAEIAKGKKTKKDKDTTA